MEICDLFETVSGKPELTRAETRRRGSDDRQISRTIYGTKREAQKVLNEMAVEASRIHWHQRDIRRAL